MNVFTLTSNYTLPVIMQTLYTFTKEIWIKIGEIVLDSVDYLVIKVEILSKEEFFQRTEGISSENGPFHFSAKLNLILYRMKDHEILIILESKSR